MTRLPENWRLVRIDQVVEPNQYGKPFQQGWSPQCEKHTAGEDEWGVLKTTAIQEGEFLPEENKLLPEGLEPRSHLEVEAGDLLLTCAGPRSRCGVACLVRRTAPRLMISGKMYRFRPNEEQILPEYLEAYLLSPQATRAIDRMKTGISDSGLNLTQGRFAKLTIPLPSLREQRRVVARLDELLSDLEKGIETLHVARKQLQVYRHAVLKQAFDGRLSANWRTHREVSLEHASRLVARIRDLVDAKYEDDLREWRSAVGVWEASGESGNKPVKPKLPKRGGRAAFPSNEGLPSLPSDWCWVSLGALFDSSLRNGLYKPATHYGSGTAIIRIDDFYDGRLVREQFKRVELDEGEITRFSLNEGDLLINRVNSIEYLGKCALIRSLPEDVVFESNIMRVSLASDVISGEYVTEYLASHDGRRRLCANAKHAVNQASINQTDVRNTPVPLAPRAEQEFITRVLAEVHSRCEHLTSEIDSSLAGAVALRQAILRRAFDGRLIPEERAERHVVILESNNIEGDASRNQESNKERNTGT